MVIRNTFEPIDNGDQLNEGYFNANHNSSFLNIQVYDDPAGNPHTFTVPNNVHRIIVECLGGGARGNGGADTRGGGGGGAGAYAFKIFTCGPGKDLEWNSSVSINVGAGGGTVEATGAEGDDTTFGAFITCGGGELSQTTGPAGRGGEATGGDLNIFGGDGNCGVPDFGGVGGASYFGSGGSGGGFSTAGSNSRIGQPGRAKGSGGGGQGVGTGKAHGNGAHGIVVVRW